MSKSGDNINKNNEIDIEELDAHADELENNTNFNNSMIEEPDPKDIKILNFNVIMLGDSNVGKTSIINKLANDSFSNKLACTISVEFFSYNLTIDKNLKVNLGIYDTAGQEKYRALTKNYFHMANGIILVFDLTDENSFNKLDGWMKEINENAGNVEIILAGNKADLEDRKISKSKADKFAKEKNLTLIETSAKEGTNILLLFEKLSNGMIKRKGDESSSLVEMGSVGETYVSRREEQNRKRHTKESKCC